MLHQTYLCTHSSVFVKVWGHNNKLWAESFSNKSWHGCANTKSPCIIIRSRLKENRPHGKKYTNLNGHTDQCIHKKHITDGHFQVKDICFIGHSLESSFYFILSWYCDSMTLSLTTVSIFMWYQVINKTNKKVLLHFQ